MSALRRLVPLGLALVLAVAIYGLAGPARAGSPAAAEPAVVAQGKEVYDLRCAQCHGREGRGDGPAAEFLLPKPRDFSQGQYKIRTTPSGELPTDEDLLEVIRRGMPGTSMPAWEILSEADRRAVVEHIKGLVLGGWQEPAEVLRVPSRPSPSQDSLQRGEALYQENECWKCHGQAGRGDGSSAPTLTDFNDVPIRAADLTQPWTFRGGARPEAVYMRLRTGLAGSPMPSFAEALSEEETWHLANYVASLGPEKAPEVQGVVRAWLAGGAPAGPDDPAWEQVPRFSYPLGGQVVEDPRLFTPSVTRMTVQAVYGAGEIAFRLVWDDPSQSPDQAWSPWSAEQHPDAAALQFPAGWAPGKERPYFLGGSSSRPVVLWLWDSQQGAREVVARGLGSEVPLEGAELEWEAIWEDGQWRVVMRRGLSSGQAESLSFRRGEFVPIALQAWDGSMGETGKRRGVSGWYFLRLEEPVGQEAYLKVAAAVLATLLVELGIIRLARRRAA